MYNMFRFDSGTYVMQKNNGKINLFMKRLQYIFYLGTLFFVIDLCVFPNFDKFE